MASWMRPSASRPQRERSLLTSSRTSRVRATRRGRDAPSEGLDHALSDSLGLVQETGLLDERAQRCDGRERRRSLDARRIGGEPRAIRCSVAGRARPSGRARARRSR